MSLQYDAYLKKHIGMVNTASGWLIENLEDEISDILPEFSSLDNPVRFHDESKYGIEYDPYDKHFYSDKKTAESEKEYEKAWLHHIHNNLHHWQHWVLIDDDINKIKTIDMPDKYIFEMICDWWSFSWINHFEIVKKMSIDEYDRYVGLDEIFNWYEDHKDSMKLSDNTRSKVEKLLEAIKLKLVELRF